MSTGGGALLLYPRKELSFMKFTFTDKKVNIPDRVQAYAEK